MAGELGLAYLAGAMDADGWFSGCMSTFPKNLLNTISCGDCLTIMRELPDECVDAFVTSPPYGLKLWYEQTDRGARAPLWHTIWLWYRCFKEYQRILKPGGYVVWNFGDNSFGKYILGTEVHTTIPMSVVAWQIGCKVGLELQATRIWRKAFYKMGVPFICNIEPRPIFDYEHIWTFRKRGNSSKPTGRGLQKVNDHKISRRGVWDTTKDGTPDDDDTVAAPHGAAYPIQIPRWAITLYSDPGDVVVDNFMGTGTTAVAAYQLGRSFYGVERDPKWVDYSLKRLEKARETGQQGKMEIA